MEHTYCSNCLKLVLFTDCLYKDGLANCPTCYFHSIHGHIDLQK